MTPFEKLCKNIEEARTEYLTMHNQPIYDNRDLLFEETFRLVCEETFKLNEITNYLYDKHFAPLLKRYKEDPNSLYLDAAKNGGRVIYSADHTFQLKGSEDVDKANETNPVRMEFGISTSYYDVVNKKITVGLHPQAVDVLGPLGLDNEKVIEDEPHIVYEFVGDKIKQTIAHELTHWIEQSIYGMKMSKVIDKANKDLKKTSDYDKKQNIMTQFRTFSEHEIQAIVNGLSAVRDDDSEKYESLNWNQVLRLSPSVKLYFDRAREKLSGDDYKESLKNMFKRLFREGLITPNMVRDINLGIK